MPNLGDVDQFGLTPRLICVLAARTDSTCILEAKISSLKNASETDTMPVTTNVGLRRFYVIYSTFITLCYHFLEVSI